MLCYANLYSTGINNAMFFLYVYIFLFFVVVVVVEFFIFIFLKQIIDKTDLISEFHLLDFSKV